MTESVGRRWWRSTTFFERTPETSSFAVLNGHWRLLTDAMLTATTVTIALLATLDVLST